MNAHNAPDVTNVSLSQHPEIGYEDPLELGPFFNSDMQWWVPMQAQ